VLDLIGDLALAGRRIWGKVVAERAGHAMHTALVQRLLRDRSAWVLATRTETVPQQADGEPAGLDRTATEPATFEALALRGLPVLS
jgi:UDP-3-O-[3-hydroxymyristoyl] N-acetylglucosamine deacetylase